MLLSWLLVSTAAAQHGAWPRDGAESGTVVSRVSGEEVRFVTEAGFRPLVLGQDLLGGDLVRTGARGVLGIVFVDGTVMRLHPQTELLVKTVGAAAQLELRTGTIWARTPRGRSDVTVTTPSAAAGIRGTDWVLSVTGVVTQLTVYDGVVELANAQGAVLAKAGEAAQAVPGRAPFKIGVANRKEAFQMMYAVGPDEAAQLISGAAEDLAAGEAVAAADLAEYRRGLRLLQLGDPAAAAVLDRVAPRLGRERGAAARWLAAIARSKAGAPLRPPPASAADADALGAAIIAGMSGDLDRVQTLLGTIAGSPAVTEAAVTLAILRDDAALARSLTRELEQSAPESAYTLAAQANIAASLDGDPVTARRLLKRAVEIVPDSTSLLNELALVEDELDHPLEAEAALRRALEIEPDNPVVLGNLAVLLLDLERIAEAKAIGEKLLAADPGSYLALRVLGRAALQENDPAAQQILLRALAAQPAAAESSILLGAASQVAGDTTRGQQEFDAAARLDPNDPIIPIIAYINALDANQADEAIVAARRAADLLNRYNRTGARIAADRSSGTPLADAYGSIGLSGWARYSADRGFDPLSAGSLFAEGQLSRLSVGRAGPNSDGFENAYINGLRLDPLSASYRLRYTDLFRRPFTDVEIGVSSGENDLSGYLSLHGFSRLPLPVAYSLQFSGVNSRESATIDTLRNSLLIAGTQFGARGRVFAVLGEDHQEVSNTQPVGLGLTALESSDDRARTGGLGGSFRLSERSFLMLFAGRTLRDTHEFSRSFAVLDTALLQFDFDAQTETQTDQISLGWQSEDETGFWTAGLEYFDELQTSNTRVDVTNLFNGETATAFDRLVLDSTSKRVFAGRRQYVNPSLTLEGLLTADRVEGEVRAGGRAGVAWTPAKGQWLRAAAVVDGNPGAVTLAPVTILGLVPLRFPYQNDGELSAVALRYDREIGSRALIGMEVQHLDLRNLTYDTGDPINSFNPDRAKATVATLQADYWLGNGVGLTGALTHSDSRIEGGVFDNSPLPEMPDWTAHLGVGWLKPSGFGGNLRAVWTSKRFSGVPGQSLPSVLTFDAVLTWESRDKRIAAGLEVLNLLDRPVALPWQMAASGRELRANLAVRF